jgi:hypothetical protein
LTFPTKFCWTFLDFCRIEWTTRQSAKGFTLTSFSTSWSLEMCGTRWRFSFSINSLYSFPIDSPSFIFPKILKIPFRSFKFALIYTRWPKVSFSTRWPNVSWSNFSETKEFWDQSLGDLSIDTRQTKWEEQGNEIDSGQKFSQAGFWFRDFFEFFASEKR